ncbi:gliding motility protein GldN [Segetibacter koreensis]|uniref:type IX secretion system ring protein PorN/GldN n=1 Tax=Segetibacter koreensis TaxID=398037 RepID=UPI0003A08408|nr:gliding motility protein GldN [Segetibacter koreensis]
MKTRMFKTGVALLMSFLVAAGVNAQKKPRTSGTRAARTRAGSGYGNTGYGNSGYTTNSAIGDTTKKKGTTTAPSGYGNQSGYGNSGTQAAATGGAQPINSNLPVTVMKSSGSGIGDSVAPSLRNDNAVERQLVRDRVPLAYENIREDDAVYRQRVWREIDTREKLNLPFRYAANEDNGNQRFISILYNAIQSGDITVFSGEDDRFTTPLTKEQVAQTITGGMDTVPVVDINGEVTGYQARQRMIEPDSIYRFRLKEEWIFDKESSRMFVRILGIAPVMRKYTSTGVDVGDVTLFWAYYPDLRPTLAKYEVYNGKNYAGRMSWEELFESRFFSSYITKSTIDNAFDRSLKEYIKDPLFRLLEGDNIKEKIFNYEQDLWSY